MKKELISPHMCIAGKTCKETKIICACGHEVELKTTCCGAEPKVDCGDEGTCCYMCSACKKPCDVISNHPDKDKTRSLLDTYITSNSDQN